MSLRLICESAFCCPHIDCYFKYRKFNSVESLNMHWVKIHDKLRKLIVAEDGRVYLRRK